MKRQIVATPGVLGGAPRLDGTRIPAETIAGLDREGFRASEIRSMYPGVTAADVRACRAWLLARRNEVPY